MSYVLLLGAIGKVAKKLQGTIPLMLEKQMDITDQIKLRGIIVIWPFISNLTEHMKRLTTLTLLLYLLSSLSCNKITVEKNDLPQGFSVSQIIGTWKVTALSSDKAYDWNGDGTPEKDIFSTWSDCEKDNLFQFQSSYSGSYKLNCNEIKNGTWGLSDTNILFWAVNGSSNLYETIIYMSTNTMKTEVITTQPNGQTYTLSKLWKLQQ